MSERHIVKVTPTLLATPIVALADLKTFMGITDTSEDTYLTTLALAVSEGLEAYVDELLGARTINETYYEAAARDCLILPYRHNISITTFTIDSTALVEDTDYVVDPAGILIPIGSYEEFRGDIVLVYTVGFADGSYPAAITQAASEATKLQRDAHKNIASGPIIKESVEGVGSTTYAQSEGGSTSEVATRTASGLLLTSGAIALLQPYRRGPECL